MRLLKEEPGIELVAEAFSFAETIKLTVALKPDVLLLDLYMPDEGEYPAEYVKSQLALHKPCVIALSLSYDDKVHALAATLWRKNFAGQDPIVFTIDASDKKSLV